MFFKSKKEKQAIKAAKERQKKIDTMPEYFDGLDPAKSVLTQGGQFGRNITIERMDKDMIAGIVVGRVNGFWTPKPSNGDYLKVNMRSGNVGLYRFANIGAGWTADRDKHPFGPSDYFEADVIWLGYETDMGKFDRETITFSD